MIIRAVTLKNFRQHADSVINFPASGLIGLHGSNEAGKSTVIEAIAFALYGTVATRGSKASIRWNRAPARRQAEVTLQFEIAGTRYTVHRTEADASVVDVTSGRKVAAGTSAVNSFLPELIGMGYEEFISTFMVGQKDLNRIAALKGTARRQLMLEVMGIGRIDEALEQCRARKNALKQEVAGLSLGLGDREPLELEAAEALATVSHTIAQLQDAHGAVTIAKREADSAAAELAESTEQQTRWRAIQSDITVAIENRAAAGREVQRVVDAIQTALLAKHQVDQHEPDLRELPELRSERDELERIRVQAHERGMLLSMSRNYAGDMLALTASIESAERLVRLFRPDVLKGNEELLAAAQFEKRQLFEKRTKAHAEARATYESGDVELRRAQRRIKAIKEAGQNGACPTCNRRLAAQYQPVLIDLETEADQIRARISAAQVRISETASPDEREVELEVEVEAHEKSIRGHRQAEAAAGRAKEQLTRDRAALNAKSVELEAIAAKLQALPDVAYDDERAAFVAAEITRLDRINASLTDARVKASRLPELEAEKLTRNLAVGDAQLTVESLREAEAAIGYDPDQHTALQVASTRATELAQKAAVLVATSEEAHRSAIARNDRSVLALGAYDSRAELLRDKQRDLHTHERAAERLADFRTAQAATIRPEMEELVSGFVSLLTDGRHEAATISDDFDVTLYEQGVPVEVISGGTEDVVALSMRLAISQMIAQRAGHPLSLLVLDEPFTSFDEVRRAGALDLIRRLRATFTQVVIISHIPELREAVDTLVAIEFDEAAGCSRIVGAPAVESEQLEAVA